MFVVLREEGAVMPMRVCIFPRDFLYILDTK
jgi:hypothetical protein